LFFRQVLYRDLGCASYVLGDAGEAVVVDPRWDIEVYLEVAAEQGLAITHVIDTHDHADHVSGRLRLVQATGAQAHRAGAGDDHAPDLIHAEDEISVGSLQVRALAAPGHRPEHLTFAVADLSRGAEPWLLLSGDSLLVGDVARPDLAYEPREGAAALHATLHELLALGDHVELWPAHVGGSLCGGSGLSHKTSSTLGFERRHNRLLEMESPQFVRAVTESLPSRPPNVERIVQINRRPAGATPAQPVALALDNLQPRLVAGVAVLDCRHPDRFDDGHLAGAINLPVSSPGVGTRAGWALDPELPIVIVADDEPSAQAMISALQSVGFWALDGYCVADLDGWSRAELPIARSDSWDLGHLAEGVREGRIELVDVRELSEWITGHVAGSHHVPLHRLHDVSSVPAACDGRTTAVACAAGMRAAFAASLLRRAGRRDVVRVAGGGIGDLGDHGIELALGA
jgi:glyoxylase-like metal-dependent hydrolase (beta-lactamase superfamily II)/rhodanese-related sulfurtransferase